jgi:hypothetical protein
MLAAGPLMIEGDDDEPIRVTRVGGYRLHICSPHREYRRENIFSKGKHHRVERNISSPICEAIIEH